MPDQMRRRTEDVVRYYGELNQRVEGTGMDGIPALLETSKRVEMALDAVSGREIEWISTEIKTLLDQLVRMSSQLQTLRALKALVEGGPEFEDELRKRASL